MHLHVIQGEAESTPMKTGEMHIRLGLKAHHMRTHMNVIIEKDLVLVEEAKIGIIKILMTKEEVLDMIKKVSNASSQLEGKSPNLQKDLDVSSPPIVRPVKDIWGDNVAPLRIIEPPTLNVGRVTDGSLRTQRTASSSSLASSNGNPAESKKEDNKQLQVNRPNSFQCKSTGVGPFGVVSSSICSGSNCRNTWYWSGFTCKQLNNFPPVSAQAGAPVGHMTVSPFGVGAPAAATTNNMTTFPSGGAPAAAPGSATAFPSNGGQ
ncbi:hypothetical protein Acr_02g0004580 [Actinidia rufa]|uniref:Uncharacterized protein n=1 Tax=Actinidia rufa TaxID=165716 RepID=A0A7J0E702_9ERIC|nr:hypothetical protein Acr_02g0004580 [Actinidia rufa]